MLSVSQLASLLVYLVSLPCHSIYLKLVLEGRKQTLFVIVTKVLHSDRPSPAPSFVARVIIINIIWFYVKRFSLICYLVQIEIGINRIPINSIQKYNRQKSGNGRRKGRNAKMENHSISDRKSLKRVSYGESLQGQQPATLMTTMYTITFSALPLSLSLACLWKICEFSIFPRSGVSPPLPHHYHPIMFAVRMLFFFRMKIVEPWQNYGGWKFYCEIIITFSYCNGDASQEERWLLRSWRIQILQCLGSWLKRFSLYTWCHDRVRYKQRLTAKYFARLL